MIKRRDSEILARIKEIENSDFFGFETTDLIMYLEFEEAEPFLKESVTEEEWEHEVDEPDKKIRDYMPFAWEKANDCRGLSASRSISHLQAWCFLHSDEAYAITQDTEYEFYGKTILVAVCEFFEIDWLALDSGYWGNDEENQVKRELVYGTETSVAQDDHTEER